MMLFIVFHLTTFVTKISSPKTCKTRPQKESKNKINTYKINKLKGFFPI